MNEKKNKTGTEARKRKINEIAKRKSGARDICKSEKTNK